MSTQDSQAYVQIDGVDYLAREWSYQASVLRIADTFSATIPAPNGRVIAADGSTVPIADVATMGANVKLSIAEPVVAGGVRVPKLIGRVTGRRMQSESGGGTVLAVSGADLGWHLSSCGQVFRNLRGVMWRDFIAKNCGFTVGEVNAATNRAPTVSDSYGWGFAGVGGGNAINRRIRQGRAGVEAFISGKQDAIVPPRFQVEVGQTIDSLLIQYAKLDHFLINVSTDGWLQIFQPDYTQAATYQFFHYGADDARRAKNNVIGPVVDESADGLYTKVECWSTVVDTLNVDHKSPNAGRYRGKYINAGTLPFPRFLTFTDTEQMGQDRVNKRAQWQWQRGVFDSYSISFETVGHSQNGVPFVEDTMATFTSTVYGIDGLFYVESVNPTRKLAPPGVSKSGAGTRCKITLRKPGLLAA